MTVHDFPKHLRTCVSPEGVFVYGVHEPHFSAANLRCEDQRMVLGRTEDSKPLWNTANFPIHDVAVTAADTLFEIPNPFPFRGVTYICKSWASRWSLQPQAIALPGPKAISLHNAIEGADDASIEDGAARRLLARLPSPLQLALATTSTDPRDLEALAIISARFIFDRQTGRPVGLCYRETVKNGREPLIASHPLFEATANNPCLPDDFKQAMVLNPGAQGDSAIVGDYRSPKTHVYEYLRCNSYIPWGHYAANMAHDAIRYDIGGLGLEDITALRHLYYQRTYYRMAEILGLETGPRRRRLQQEELETLRRSLLQTLRRIPLPELDFSATLWGWNYGFDYTPSGYRLHATHQQIHQQFALIPDKVKHGLQSDGCFFPAYACGDLIHDFIERYRKHTGKSFFACYQQALENNHRLDGGQAPSSLIIFSDDQVSLFVPKAQTSQWELQLMTRHPVGNILEADTLTRQSLDQAMHLAMTLLTQMGARMITVFEYSKRFHHHASDQRLLYAFLPRLPESPGAFSEAQLRWINGHYPEDFAQACRLRLEALTLV